MRKLFSGMLLLSMLTACGGAATTTTPATTGTAAATTAPTTAAATAAAPTVAATTAPMTDTAAPTTAAATAAPTAGTATGGSAAEVALPEVDVLEVTGDIITAGSSTVYPLSEAIAERFKEEGYADNLTIDNVGSGAGFERFCVAAETDIANASREIKDEEIESCKAKGREPIAFRVGTDALVVAVSNQNTFAKELTTAQLQEIFSGKAKMWSDVDASYPAQAIKLFSPGTDSGTFDYFVEVIFEKKKEELLAANPQLSEDDNVLVQGVSGDQYAIGYFGYAYYKENASKLTPLSIDGVAPTEETAEDNSYSLSRPLFIYSDAKIMKEKPQVAAFINFYLSFVNEEIIDAGYFPASTGALNEAKEAYLNAVK